MQIEKAITSAAVILDEERQRPTIRYTDIANDWVTRYNQMTREEIASWTKITSVVRRNLFSLREQYPRGVSQTPQAYSFTGANYDLLLALFSQVSPVERPKLIDYLLTRVESGKAHPVSAGPIHFPAMGSSVSELPLIAEFCIRSGNTDPLFESIARRPVASRAVAIMMMQLEETLALNFNLFSNEQLAAIPLSLAPLREISYRQAHKKTGPSGGPFIANPHYSQGNESTARRIVRSIDGIVKECEQARYWYLKGALLQQTVNLEIESDRVKVEDFLAKLGFDDQMVRALNAAENDYKLSTTLFDLKSSLGHLRSFLEHLHRETAKSIAGAAGETVIDRWGDATSYLRKKDVLTRQEEQFLCGAVHPYERRERSPSCGGSRTCATAAQ